MTTVSAYKTKGGNVVADTKSYMRITLLFLFAFFVLFFLNRNGSQVAR